MAAITARVLVLVPFFEGEGKSAHEALTAIVSDFAQHHGFASGVMGTEGGGGAARRFHYVGAGQDRGRGRLTGAPGAPSTKSVPSTQSVPSAPSMPCRSSRAERAGLGERAGAHVILLRCNHTSL